MNSINPIFLLIFVFWTMLTDLSLGTVQIKRPLFVTVMSDGLLPDLVWIDVNSFPWRLKRLKILSSPLDDQLFSITMAWHIALSPTDLGLCVYFGDNPWLNIQHPVWSWGNRTCGIFSLSTFSWFKRQQTKLLMEFYFGYIMSWGSWRRHFE